jgi:ribosomal protein L37AE/L43A
MYNSLMAELNSDRRKNYSKRKKSGCCPRCGKTKSKREKFIYCDDCREYFRDYGNMTSEKTQKKRRAIYKQRKKQGLCPRCGEKKPKNYTKSMCAKCLKKAKILNNK